MRFPVLVQTLPSDTAEMEYAKRGKSVKVVHRTAEAVPMGNFHFAVMADRVPLILWILFSILESQSLVAIRGVKTQITND